MAYDGTHLWFHGHNYSMDEEEFLKVDVSDPLNPALEESYPNAAQLQALAWDGTQFWGLTSSQGYLVRMDPATFETEATYSVPDLDLDFYGLAAVGSDFYLLGKDESVTPEQAVIVKVTP